MKLYFAPLFLLLLILNCTKNTGVIPGDEAQLNEQKWKNKGITDYEFTSQISCFCLDRLYSSQGYSCEK